MSGGMSMSFNWRFGDYGVCEAEANKTSKRPIMNFVRYYHSEYFGKEMCYVIGYFYYNEHEPCWEMKWVGNRFLEVESKDIVPIWEVLKTSYKILEAWKEDIENDE